MSVIIEDEEDKGPQWSEDDTMQIIMKESVENVLKASEFDKERIKSWAVDIGERCLRGLSGLQKPFKFIVEVTIMQKNGAGLHSSTSCFWETAQDGVSLLRWDNETINCIVTVIGVGI